MTVSDRLRIEWAVASYDWWLDLRGTPRRRRRDLRSELRSNLRDATAHSGSKAAPHDPTRARWTAGLQAGGAALGLALLVVLVSTLAWADGVIAADPDRTVSGSVTLLPGSSMQYAPLADGFSVSTDVGWLPLVAGVLVFVAVARPWRALPSRRAGVPHY